jgi:uncharacterized protein
MVRIGLLSDTHGWLDPKLRGHFATCDEVWHAGDIGALEVADELAQWKPLRAVHGNIDGTGVRSMYKEHQRFTVEGAKVWLTHIGGRPPRYTPMVLRALRLDPPSLFICGHSHICAVRFDPALNVLYVNPGAAGRQGFHNVRTAVRFTINGERLEGMEVIELGARGSLLG